MPLIVLFNKPMNVLSQFTDIKDRPTLADYIDIPQVYPAGRLDYDSEGLLVLTDNGQLQKLISNPKYKSPKTYWVQVEGEITNRALKQLSTGIELKDGKTKPAKIIRISAPAIWERSPPIRYRKNVPTSWVSLTITEGKNRQVRRMTAAAGFPTLRLVRQRIGNWSLDGLAPGEWKSVHHRPSHSMSL